MSEQLIGIAEAATRLQFTPRAIRFYEERGLLKTHRGLQRRRLLDRAAMTRLVHIKALKEQGLTISAIREAIHAANGGTPSLTTGQLEAQLGILRGQRAKLDEQIRALMRMRVATA